jgi:hypothetical protein
VDYRFFGHCPNILRDRRFKRQIKLSHRLAIGFTRFSGKLGIESVHGLPRAAPEGVEGPESTIFVHCHFVHRNINGAPHNLPTVPNARWSWRSRLSIVD